MGSNGGGGDGRLSLQSELGMEWDRMGGGDELLDLFDLLFFLLLLLLLLLLGHSSKPIVIQY